LPIGDGGCVRDSPEVGSSVEATAAGASSTPFKFTFNSNAPEFRPLLAHQQQQQQQFYEYIERFFVFIARTNF
jgi:hypothetical protein